MGNKMEVIVQILLIEFSETHDCSFASLQKQFIELIVPLSYLMSDTKSLVAHIFAQTHSKQTLTVPFSR